ncbi:hypothetical protein [Polyangium sp. 6x1]|uniref:hypothetical protein n=1 Tax=Polyangium sp. 6x1 TaxID=3042689 RepID=UPI0024828991|nr:hypothetical protein [Polyangium sp. 6x1]MDI1449345.1 hypothetical protein [Polyangium sp. 6x1]
MPPDTPLREGVRHDSGTLPGGAPSTVRAGGAESTSAPAPSIEAPRNAHAPSTLDELAARIEGDMSEARRAGRYEDAARLARALAALLQDAPAGVKGAPAPTVESSPRSAPASKVKASRKRRA